jgi:hypothetical protein
MREAQSTNQECREKTNVREQSNRASSHLLFGQESVEACFGFFNLATMIDLHLRNTGVQIAQKRLACGDCGQPLRVDDET